MKYYLISIGGTGAKCLEAFVHMNAAGLMRSNDKINIIYVDPDASNGNLSRAKNAVATYVKAFGGVAQDENFFKNALSPEEITWNPVPEGSAANLSTIFGRSTMKVKSEELGALFDVLFSTEEQNTLLTEGFRAHPSIGAAVIGANMDMDADDSVWKQMVNDIGEQEARIFFFGSVFGGTGAAGFPNIAKLIRDYFDDKAVNNNPDSKNKKKDERIKMGGCLMLPYFTFPKASELDMIDPNDPDKQIIVPDSGKFLASTYAALNYYNNNALVGNIFDKVYLLGDRKFVGIEQYKAGRADQKNKAHFLEMLAALAAFEFFNKDSKDKDFTEPKCFMMAIHGEDFDWKDLPSVYPGCDMEGKLKTFIRMAYMYRTMVYPKLEECYQVEEKYKDNPWIGDFLHELRPVTGITRFIKAEKDQAYITDENHKIILAFRDYCVRFLDWLKDFTFSEDPAALRCGKLVNKDIYTYDDTKSYEENMANLINPEDIFVEKTNTTFDAGENNFLQQMVNSDREAKGMKPLLAMVYELCKDGKEVK